MDQPVRSSDKTAIACGLLSAAMGLFFLLTMLGIVGPPPRPSAGSERWVGVLAGLVFIIGGLAVVIQSTITNAPGPNGELPPGTPPWILRTMRLMTLSIVVSLAAIGSWVAFGPGAREFSTNIPFLPPWLNELVGRSAFGVGAALIWIVLIVMAVIGARRRLRRTAPRFSSARQG